MRHPYFPCNDRSCTTAILILAGLFFLSPAAHSRVPLSEKTNRANQYYDEAQQALSDLQEIPATQRHPKDYEKVVRAFRRVYQTAATSPQNAKSFLAIGELYQAMGHDFGKDKYFHSAAEAYEFLLKEYPHSKHQPDALLALARIYQSDLKQPDEARKRLDELLEKYPNSVQAKDARVAPPEEKAEAVLPKAEPPAPAAASIPEPPPAAVPQTSGERVAITSIRQWPTPGSTRVVIDVGGEVKYDIGRLNRPPRVYLDLHGTTIGRALARTILTDEGMVKRVRAAQFSADTTRVVLEMDPSANYDISDLPNPYRLIIDVHTKQAAAPPAPAVANQQPEVQPASLTTATKSPAEVIQPASVAAIEPVPVQAAPSLIQEKTKPLKPKQTEAASLEKISPPPTAERQIPPSRENAVAERTEANDNSATFARADKIQPAQPNRDGTRSLTRALGLKIGRIILDPGHGGHDTGTIGPTGLYEKDLVLDVALRLGELLTARLGSEVVYTRDDDTFVPLESRTAVANEKQADLFLSIHANSSRIPSARGVESYYLSFNTDPDALEVAARENAPSQESIHELQDLVKKIALNEKVDESKEFAADVQSALSARLGQTRKNRGVKKAPFVVLVGARMPSVLAEISFLSNPQEEKLLRTGAQRQRIAEALYAGVKKYADTLSGVKVAHNGDLAAAK